MLIIFEQKDCLPSLWSSFVLLDFCCHCFKNLLVPLPRCKIISTCNIFSLLCERYIVRQLEADILTISRGNSILVLSCFFKVSKYIFFNVGRVEIFLWVLDYASLYNGSLSFDVILR